jgi:4-diphosphocytidyl-2-C-methyl-D-erythritol kinase
MYTIEAPCKINLHLKVGEKNEDGFHNLESIFACMAFSDSLSFEYAGKEGDCFIEMAGEEIPAEKNLVFKAVSLFRQSTGFSQGLHVSINKRIPIGAGLGGGSSDAASTLLALNFLAGQKLAKQHEDTAGASGLLPTENLQEMAAALGSDVPFFLTGGTAWISGRGEIIEPLPSPQGLWVVLAKPAFSSDTATAYELLDKFRALEKAVKKPEKALAKEALVGALEQGPETWPFFNDFLTVFLESQGAETHTKADVYTILLDEFINLKACFAGLSGSGSCCFGVFKNRKEAEAAEKALKIIKNYQFFTHLTFFLASRQLRY